MKPRVLCVDDEPNILHGLRRHLRRDYDVSTAVGGEEGLRLLEEEGPFVVVVSDQRMPGMDGVTFLRKVREVSPGTIRIMLTGQADLRDAAAAVNEGSVFRFLTKPVLPEVLLEALAAAVRQHELERAEKELLEETLAGSVRVLTEILSIISPTAFSRVASIHAFVQHLGRRFSFPAPWRLDIAGRLVLLGCVTVPGDVLERWLAGQEFDAEELELVAAAPRTAAELLSRIPRLEDVAAMLAAQADPPPDPAADPAGLPPTVLGGQILRTAVAYDLEILRGRPRREALAALRERTAEFLPALVDALADAELPGERMVLRTVHADELAMGMVLDQDLRARNGLVLLRQGQEITFAVLERLRAFARGVGIEEPVRVKVAAGSAVAEKV